jgi:hypothetical protein
MDSNEDKKEEQTNMNEKILAALERISTRMDVIEGQTRETSSRISILEGERTLDQEDVSKREDNPNTKERRSTRFNKLVAENKVLSNRHQVQVIKEPPSHRHIYLKSTKLQDYVKFVNDWMDYGIRHGINLEPAQIVSNTIRQRLLDKYEMTEQDFLKLSAEEFCQLMAGETRVFSVIAFAETLETALSHIKPMPWDKVTPANHEDFYNSVLRLNTVFERTVNILMEMNSEFAPRLDDKKWGLAVIYLRKIDKGYREVVLAEIPKLRQENYHTIHDFVKTFKERAFAHYERSRTMSMIPYRGVQFSTCGGLDQKEQIAVLNVIRTSNEVRDVHDSVEMNDDELYLDERPGHDQASSDADDPGNEMEELYINELTDQERVVLQGIEPSGKGEGQYPTSCIYYAIFGECKRGSECKNKDAHNAQAADRTRKWLRQKLDEQGPRTQGVTLLRRDRSTT